MTKYMRSRAEKLFHLVMEYNFRRFDSNRLFFYVNPHIELISLYKIQNDKVIQRYDIYLDSTRKLSQFERENGIRTMGEIIKKLEKALNNDI